MPAWLDDAVFYEIYPQSFRDTNADGIGDFQGIIDSIPYIRELGCNAIWMNPCFDSPFYDAGYDIRDYYTAAPRYGTNADLKRLFDAVHAAGMHIILDLVPGHTSIDCEWFKQSCKAEKNEYTSRYIWSDSVWENMSGIENIAGVLRGVSERNASVATNFFSTQPALNYGFAQVDKPWQMHFTSPEAAATLDAMMDVMRFWLQMGADGFRVDMAGSLIKADKDQQETIRLWRKVRAFLDREFPEAVMISEWGQPDRSLAGGFHMDFLLAWADSQYTELLRTDTPYFGSKSPRTGEAFAERYDRYRASVGGKGLICIPSGNHDTPRLRHFLTETEMKVAFAFLLTMPGAPFIYYGDEIAMRYLPDLPSVEGGYERTGTRTPMQWDATVNAGFSAARTDKLYIRQDPDPDRPTVARSMADPDSVWSTVHALLALRKAHPALQTNGMMTFLSTANGAMVYSREAGEEKLVVLLNPKAADAACTWEGCDALAEAAVIYSLNGAAGYDGMSVTVPAGSATVLRLKQK